MCDPVQITEFMSNFQIHFMLQAPLTTGCGCSWETLPQLGRGYIYLSDSVTDTESLRLTNLIF